MSLTREQINAIRFYFERGHVLAPDTRDALCTLALEGLEAREQRQSRVEYTKSARAALERKPE